MTDFEKQIKNVQSLLEYLPSVREEVNTSEELQAFKRKFKQPRPGGFIAGIKDLIKIANIPLDNRDEVLGNKFSGFFYEEDLLTVWNGQFPEKKITQIHLLLAMARKEDELCLLPLFSNELNADDRKPIFFYTGPDPSGALDALVKGPSVIDCNMFIDIAMYFGFRAVLGDECFNQEFGNKPLCITYFQLPPDLFTLIEPFSNKAINDRSSILAVYSFRNHPNYKFKHPAGSREGINCIGIKNTYSVFNPTLKKNIGLTRKEIKEILINAFNKPQDSYDLGQIANYECIRQDKYPQNPSLTFPDVAGLSKSFAEKTIDSETFTPDSRCVFTLNVTELENWLVREKLKQEEFVKIDETYCVKWLNKDLKNIFPNSPSLRFFTIQNPRTYNVTAVMPFNSLSDVNENQLLDTITRIKNASHMFGTVTSQFKFENNNHIAIQDINVPNETALQFAP